MRFALFCVLLCLTQKSVYAQKPLIPFDQGYLEYGYQSLYDSSELAVNDLVVLLVFYALDKGEIQESSHQTLDSLAFYLLRNSKLIVEIQNHCDERRSDYSSRRLEQARAQAVVDYLINSGVPREQLYAKGYGEALPLVENVSKMKITMEEKERLHQINRRTAMKVIATDN